MNQALNTILNTESTAYGSLLFARTTTTCGAGVARNAGNPLVSSYAQSNRLI